MGILLMLRDVRLSIERDHTHIGLCSVVTYRVTQYVTVTSSSLANVYFSTFQGNYLMLNIKVTPREL